MSHTLGRQTNTWTPFPACSLPGLTQPPGVVPPGSGEGEAGGHGGGIRVAAAARDQPRLGVPVLGHVTRYT